jgi:HPt (histidine-containing phosphotransfer) domain-containing protein
MIEAIGAPADLAAEEPGTGIAAMSAAHGDSADVLDLAVIEDWRSFLPEGDFANMVDVQVADSQDILDRIKDAAARAACDELGGLAHDLKSSSGAIGMLEVQRLAEQIEHACRDGRHDEALALAPAVEAAVGAAVGALRARMAA